jgi:ADP-dependent NAD(P)H-hydrate dehydratase
VTSEVGLPLPELPARRPESHKGDFGRALLVGGSRGMTGAAALAGMAALRSGAGLVTLAVPDRCLELVASFDPCYMTVSLPCDRDGRLTWDCRERLDELTRKATCVGLGPGLGRSPDLDRLTVWLYQNVAAPVVVDADALNALSSATEPLAAAAGPRILTPHPGEFRRLIADGTQRVGVDELQDRAVQLALRYHAVMVLKGHRTLVTDGDRMWVNTTGNPGMSTGGSGDVLTGVITALVCQGLPPFEAAQLAVHLHGLAGDLAAEQLGQVSMTAADLLRFLPAAFLSLRTG